MRRIYTGLLLCLISVCNGQGVIFHSNDSYTSIALSTGLCRFTVKDEVISPLIYKGGSVQIRLQYDRRKEKNAHSVTITYASPKLRSEQSSSYTNTYYGLIQYQYQRTIKSTKKSDWGLGTGTQLYALYKQQYYSKGGTSQAGDLFASIPLHASFRKRIKGNKELTIQAGYSVISWIVGEVYSLNQPPASMLYDDGFSLGHLLDGGKWTAGVVDFQSVVTYRYAIHPRLGLSLTYWFRYYQYHKLPLVQAGVHQFLGGIHFKIV